MKPIPFQKRQQAGVALIVALVLLIVMTMLGLMGVRGALQQEKMTGNTYDRSLAFQSAEAALRAGEAVAQAQSTNGNNGMPNSGDYVDADSTCGVSSCNAGLCAQPDPDCTPRWEDSAFNSWANASSLGAVAGTPQYFVEYLGGGLPCDPKDLINNRNCRRYRVTARSDATDGDRAAVMLQSIFATD